VAAKVEKKNRLTIRRLAAGLMTMISVPLIVLLADATLSTLGLISARVSTCPR
jgi:hypothetical protein